MKTKILTLILFLFVIPGFSQTHFIPGFQSGGFTQMDIAVGSALLNNTPLETGDEIGVFDGNLCCGVLRLNKPFTPPELLIAGGNDGPSNEKGPNGFTTGNKIYLRFWDNSDSKEYHNVIVKFYDPSVTPPQEISPQLFSPGITVFITAEVTADNTTKTWTNNATTSWDDAAAWSPTGVPDPTSDVIIPFAIPGPIISESGMAYCGSLSINNPVTIKSGALATGSLIVSNAVTGTGILNAERYMPSNGWHMVSSPVKDQMSADFLSANSIIPTNGSSQRGMMEYDEEADNWSDFYTASTQEQITLAKGYSIRSASNGSVTFSGMYSNNDITVRVNKSANSFGWNLLGNPFTSAIYVNQVIFGFLVQNALMLDANYLGIYLWDPTANAGSGGYTPLNLSDYRPKIAVGQGFFIKAAMTGDIIFNKQMQVHQTDAPFKSAAIGWPSLVLNAKSSNLSASTKILFHEEMTAGLDPGYDAGILKSGNGFDIYSRLVTDNGVDFMVQALPVAISNYVIPIGIDATKGGEIVFSAQALNLPAGFQVFLEDKLSNKIIGLNGNDQYTAAVTSGTKGTGRFYLHVGSSVQTAVPILEDEKISVYTSGDLLYISGNTEANEKIAIYTIDGKLKEQRISQPVQLQKIDISGYSPGVYILRLGNGRNIAASKFVKR